MASSRTANEIIADALKLLGNETIADEAKVWLNNFLDRLYEDHRWPFQEKSASGVLLPGQTSVPLPADFLDFWDRNGLRLEDEHGAFSRILTTPADDFDLLARPDMQSRPETALVDLAAHTWQPYPRAHQQYTWHLRYKYHPGRLDDEAEPSEFDDVITFPNDELLTQAVFVRGLQYEDDDRYSGEKAILDDMVRRFRKGYNISPTKGTTIRFSSQTFRKMQALR